MTLQDRIAQLKLPDGMTCGDAACLWDVPYVRNDGCVWAQIAYDPLDGPFVLAVGSPDWAFAFAPDGSISRVRAGDHYALATGDKEAAFARFVAALAAAPRGHAFPAGAALEEDAGLAGEV